MKAYQVKHNDLFNTPSYVFEQLNSIYNFSVDAACCKNNKKVANGFCIDEGIDGLSQSWEGQRVFCNPPFSQKKKWIKKAIEEVEHNNCPVCVMILPLNCMSTNFFFDMVIKGGYHYQIPKGRIGFLDNETKKESKGNYSGTVIVSSTTREE